MVGAPQPACRYGEPVADDDRDGVDEILEQWRRERPDVDTSAMGLIGRIGRLERVIRPQLDKVFASHGLESWEFDVLATLRRSGEPFTLTAGALLSSMMITSGTMTNRIDRLQQRGFVERRSDPADGRVVLVALADAGMALIDRALPDHAANESMIVSSLSARDRTTLQGLLRQFLVALSADAQ